jgi:hypothetical protein
VAIVLRVFGLEIKTREYPLAVGEIAHEFAQRQRKSLDERWCGDDLFLPG